MTRVAAPASNKSPSTSYSGVSENDANDFILVEKSKSSSKRTVRSGGRRSAIPKPSSQTRMNANEVKQFIKPKAPITKPKPSVAKNANADTLSTTKNIPRSSTKSRTPFVPIVNTIQSSPQLPSKSPRLPDITQSITQKTRSPNSADHIKPKNSVLPRSSTTANAIKYRGKLIDESDGDSEYDDCDEPTPLQNRRKSVVREVRVKPPRRYEIIRRVPDTESMIVNTGSYIPRKSSATSASDMKNRQSSISSRRSRSQDNDSCFTEHSQYNGSDGGLYSPTLNTSVSKGKEKSDQYLSRANAASKSPLSITSPPTGSTAVIMAQLDAARIPMHVPRRAASPISSNTITEISAPTSQAYQPINSKAVERIGISVLKERSGHTTSANGKRTSVLLPRVDPLRTIAPLRIKKKGVMRSSSLHSKHTEITLASLPTQIIEHSPANAYATSGLARRSTISSNICGESKAKAKSIWTMADEIRLVRSKGILSPSEKLIPDPDYRMTALCLRRYNGVPLQEKSILTSQSTPKSMSIPAHLMGPSVPSYVSWNEQERTFLRRQKALDEQKTNAQMNITDKNDGAIVTTSPYHLPSNISLSKLIPAKAKGLVRLFSVRNLSAKILAYDY